MTARTFVINGTAPLTGGPDWYNALSVNGWSAVPTSNTLGNVLDPNAYSHTSASAPSNIIRAYTGGCADQVRGEIILCANGGHDDYHGNEAYACLLKSNTPQWYRLSDSSPPSVTQLNATIAQFGGYTDGRMGSVHGYNRQVFANGRAWFLTTDAYSRTGGSMNYSWSFNREYPGVPTAPGQTALAYDGTPGPWTNHGYVGYPNNSALYQAGAAYDPVGNKVWSTGQNTVKFFAADVGGVAAPSTFYGLNTPNVFNYYGWLCVADDPTGADRWRILVASIQGSTDLLYVDLKNPTAGWTRVTTTGGVAGYSNVVTQVRAAHYDRVTAGVYAFCANWDAGIVKKLTIPVDGSGNFTPGGTWAWSSMPNTTGVIPAYEQVTAGTYGKFNIIKDMGNGRAALTIVTGLNTPVYVYPL